METGIVKKADTPVIYDNRADAGKGEAAGSRSSHLSSPNNDDDRMRRLSQLDVSSLQGQRGRFYMTGQRRE